MSNNLKNLKAFKLLIIEDDKTILSVYLNTLKIFFSEVYSADDGQTGYELYEDLRPNIILIDLILPDTNGFKIIEQIRAKDTKTPIVVLSGMSDTETLLKAANSHIDGYLIKPIILEELIIKLVFALRRAHILDTSIKFKNGTEINFDTREIIHEKSKHLLGKKEQQLLELFITNNNKILSKEDIIDYIWPIESVTESALKNLLSRFRSKVGEDIIISHKNIGWKLNTELLMDESTSILS